MLLKEKSSQLCDNYHHFLAILGIKSLRRGSPTKFLKLNSISLLCALTSWFRRHALLQKSPWLRSQGAWLAKKVHGYVSRGHARSKKSMATFSGGMFAPKSPWLRSQGASHRQNDFGQRDRGARPQPKKPRPTRPQLII